MNRDVKYIESIVKHCDNIEEAVQIYDAALSFKDSLQ